MVLVVKNLPANAGDVRETGSTSGLGRYPGGGHGNPLHYSCLENPMDRGAWRATVHRIAKSWTWQKWLSTHTPAGIWPSWNLNSALSGFKYILSWSIMWLHLRESKICKWSVYSGYNDWFWNCTGIDTCLSLYFLSYVLWATSISHSILGNNQDLINHSIFQLMSVSSRYSCLSLSLLFSFTFLFYFLMNE